MLKYIEELDNFIITNNISKEDICIVGSAVFSLYGVRQHNDIDFILKPKLYKVFKKKKNIKIGLSGHFTISKNIDIYRNRYYINSINDNLIFEEKLYYKINGYKIILPEVEYIYKMTKYRNKDKKDLKIINKKMNQWKDFDLNLVEKLMKKSDKNKRIKRIMLKIDRIIKEPKRIIYFLKRIISNENK